MRLKSWTAAASVCGKGRGKPGEAGKQCSPIFEHAQLLRMMMRITLTIILMMMVMVRKRIMVMIMIMRSLMRRVAVIAIR